MVAKRVPCQCTKTEQQVSLLAVLLAASRRAATSENQHNQEAMGTRVPEQVSPLQRIHAGILVVGLQDRWSVKHHHHNQPI